MNSKVIKLFALLFAVSILFTGCSLSSDKNADSTKTSTTNASTSSVVTGTGIMSSFSAQDLYGNTVDQSVLKDYKVTMVNVWATYCGYCINEMPYLAELNDEYKSRGFQIIGIVTDLTNYDGSVSSSQMSTAKSIISTTGADYTHLIASSSLNSVLSLVSGVPTTVFVDKDGNIIGKQYSGAKSKAAWEEIIDSKLNEA